MSDKIHQWILKLGGNYLRKNKIYIVSRNLSYPQILINYKGKDSNFIVANPADTSKKIH